MEIENIELLLSDYFRGEISQDEGHLIDEWILESSDHRKIALQYCRLEQLAQIANAMDKSGVEKARDKVIRRIRQSKVRKVGLVFQKIAAILIVPVLLAATFFSVHHFRGEYNQPIVLHTITGMTSYTTLPDGSEVWLNSNSTLTYPARFKNTRKVVLSGEGYFKVKKKPGQKFIVLANGVEVEALGTEFDVEAYSETTPNVYASLFSGSIRLSYQDYSNNQCEMILNPGDQFIIDTSSKQAKHHFINPIVTSAWRDGKVILDNTTLEDALHILGNRYNVEFLVRNTKLLNNRYTGIFSSQQLDVVLEHFERTTDIHFERDLARAESGNYYDRQIIIVY